MESVTIAIRNTKNQRARERLFKRQLGKCFYCGETLAYASEGVMDHFISRSKGGGDGLNNRVLACVLCDRIKGPFTSLDEVKNYTEKLIAFFERLEEKLRMKEKKLRVLCHCAFPHSSKVLGDIEWFNSLPNKK